LVGHHLNDLGIVWVRDLGNDEANHLGGSGFEVSSYLVDLISRFLGKSLDELLSFGID